MEQYQQACDTSKSCDECPLSYHLSETRMVGCYVNMLVSGIGIMSDNDILETEVEINDSKATT